MTTMAFPILMLVVLAMMTTTKRAGALDAGVLGSMWDG